MTPESANARPDPDAPDTSTAALGPRPETGLSVLVIDPDPEFRRWIEHAIDPRVALVETVASLAPADALCERCHFDTVVVEATVDGGEGVAWLRRHLERGRRWAAIVTSEQASLEQALDALRLGALDFLSKPFRIDALLATLDQAATRRDAGPAAEFTEPAREALDGELIGTSAAMREVCRTIRRVAPTPVSVLIQGESGTGKELAARMLHRLSARRGEFVALNCGAVSPELLESELFGHAKGAFTGAYHNRDGLFCTANRGTLFLDEIGEMPPPMQVKLLRALEEREVRPVGADRAVPVDARVIAATNRPLADDVRRKGFREDLFFRLDVLAVTMPPLRERREDVAPIAEHYSNKLARELGLAPAALSEADLRALEGADWPGNVRELINVLERCLLLGRTPAAYLAEAAGAGRPSVEAVEEGRYPLGWTLREIGKAHTLRVLAYTGGNKTQAAKRLGVSRKTLERNLRAWSQEDTQGPDRATPPASS